MPNARSAAAAEGLPANMIPHRDGAELGVGTTMEASAFRQLETPIERVAKFARLLNVLSETLQDGCTSEFEGEIVASMCFVVGEALQASNALEDLWLAQHSTACAVEVGEVAR